MGDRKWHRSDVLLFTAALFVSAILLFALQPMFAKMVLPLLGGAPAVWNTCLVFYQATLLGGYFYAHLSLKWLGPRRQAALHMVMLCLIWLVLPIHVAAGWIPPPDVSPIPWLWMLLLISIGLPFLFVSASAPMLQAWFARGDNQQARDPYFLYAASNLGSLLALLGYPLLIEVQLTLTEQTRCWTAGYGLLMAMVAGCAIRLWRSSPAPAATLQSVGEGSHDDRDMYRPNLLRRLRWVVLSLVPSSLLLGLTNYISTDLAAMPLLWVVPLAIYLLTFVLIFAKRSIIPLEWMVRAQPYLILPVAVAMLWIPTQPAGIILLGAINLAAFFVTAMVCHGQLFAERPAARHLTEFYLWMSLGGVLGGLFNTLAAPVIFSSVLEYPLMIAVACALRPPKALPERRAPIRQVVLPLVALLICIGMAWGMHSESILRAWRYLDTPAAKLTVVGLAAGAAFLLRRRPLRFGLGVAAVSALSLWCADTEMHLLHAERSFFGVLRVEYDPVWNMRRLMHGSTEHGLQSLDPNQRHEPWSYYHRKGPLGAVFQALRHRRPLAEIGVLGLGTGAIAAYGEPGERITYYEIDPAVERIARNPGYFTYLADCRAKLQVILGDARLSLVHGPARQFDLLVVDVFSSDSVPVHLITREALKVYLERLTEQGLLAINISNRHLDLKPVLGELARDASLAARVSDDAASLGAVGKSSSTWAVMARRTEDLGPLTRDPRWLILEPGKGRLWTDDFSNIVGALKWQLSIENLRPSAWWRNGRADAQVSLATALFNDGRIDEAIAHYRQALEITPDDAEVHNNLGAALLRAAEIPEAIAQCERALQLNPDYADAHNNLGNGLLVAGRAKEAIAHFERALQLNPEDAGAQNNLGSALLGTGKIQEALVHGERAVQLNPIDASAHYNLGNALLAAGKTHEAITSYRMSLQLNPDFALARKRLAEALAGGIHTQIKQYEKELEQHPDSAELLGKLAGLLLMVRRTSEAMTHLERAVQLNPNDAETHNNLAWLLATQEPAPDADPARAVALAQRACKLTDNKSPGCLDTLGVAYAAAGRFPEAIATAQKAIALASAAGQALLTKQIEARLALYKQGRPYREPAPTPGK